MEGGLFNLQSMDNEDNTSSHSDSKTSQNVTESISSSSSNKSSVYWKETQPNNKNGFEINIPPWGNSFNKKPEKAYANRTSANQTQKEGNDLNGNNLNPSVAIITHPPGNCIESLWTNRNNLSEFVKFVFWKMNDTSKYAKSYVGYMENCGQNNNTQFNDLQFPANENSLIKGYFVNKNSKNRNENGSSSNNNNNIISVTTTELQKHWREVEWKSLSKELKYWTIFPKNNYMNIKSKDIIPGEWSNQKFVSAVSALAEYPDLINKIFITNAVNDKGIYSVKLCCDGLLQEVCVDDFIPYYKGKLGFISDSKKTLWSSWLEKCYAKVYGSYNSIEIKNVEGILRDWTCAPVKTWENSNEDWVDQLLKAKEENWIILVSAGETGASQELLEMLNLKSDYEYLVLSVNQVIHDNQFVSEIDKKYHNTILTIRNWWSKIKWTGDWSNISHWWKDNIKQWLNYNQDDDTTFYMNFKDFKHHFSKVKIVKYIPTYKYTSIKVHQNKDDYVWVKIKSQSKQVADTFWSLVQEDKIDFAKNEYVYGISRLILSKISYDDDNPKTEKGIHLEYLVGKIGQEREVTIEDVQLIPGEYLLYCELNKSDRRTPYIISAYSSKMVELSLVDKDEHPNILETIYMSCAKKQNCFIRYKRENAPECIKYTNSTAEGYTYIYIENNEDDATLIEDVKYTKFQGLQLVPPYSGTSYQIEVGPGERKLVLIKQWEINEYNWIYSYKSHIKLGEKTWKKLAKEKGTKKSRKDIQTQTELDINVYMYKYNFGLCYYYENNTKNKRLKEKLDIKSNTNVDFVGPMAGKTQVWIIVEPGETNFIEWRGNNTLWKVQPMIWYSIENADSEATSCSPESK